MATSEVVVRAFTDMGLTSVLGDCMGFINVDERFLISEIVELPHRERVVRWRPWKSRPHYPSLWQVNQTQLQALSWANELSASNSEK